VFEKPEDDDATDWTTINKDLSSNISGW